MAVIHLNIIAENSTVAAQDHTRRELPVALQCAYQKAREIGLDYAGNVLPEDAWKLFVGGQAHLIDVRTVEERRIFGLVPNTFHITWQATSSVNPFLRELEKKLPKDAIILLLCSTGKCSVAAAIAATAAGFKHVFTILGGFDGDRNHWQPRDVASGWRQRGLPWLQH
jgi:rhodanese-related sulfurtransferase